MLVSKTKEIILGIDPGSLITGYAVLGVKEKDVVELISMGVIKMSSSENGYIRLEKIYTRLLEIIQLYQPKYCAIEAPFYAKNIQSMLKLGRAQGVAIAAAIHQNLGVTEYSPKEVKLAITGNGNASKEQVLKMLQQLLYIQATPSYYDASDALSIAYCHYLKSSRTHSLTQQTKKNKKGNTWGEFIKQNPDRIIR